MPVPRPDPLTLTPPVPRAPAAVPAGISAHTPRVIVGARPDELMLYQTERYALKSFSYEAKQPTDGDYVLVLKFAEVCLVPSLSPA